MQCCLKPLGQRCIGFSAVQCWVKSIKTTMNRVFSYAMFPGASRTTLHRVFTCALLFGASWKRLHRGFHLCNIVSRVSPGTTLHSKNLMWRCLWGSRNHFMRKNLIQCCLNTHGTTCLWSSRHHCMRKNLIQCYLNALGVTIS